MMNNIIKQTKDCSCIGCINACKRYPGWFHPDQIYDAASYLGLTIQEFFDSYLVAEKYDYYDDNFEYIGPISGLSQLVSV